MPAKKLADNALQNTVNLVWAQGHQGITDALA